MGTNLRLQEKISLCSIGCAIYHHNIYAILHGFLAQFLHEYYVYRWFSGTVSWFSTHLIQECQSKAGVYKNACSFLDIHLYVDLSVNESTVNLFQMPSTIMNLQMGKNICCQQWNMKFGHYVNCYVTSWYCPAYMIHAHYTCIYDIS
jgi:hypothetical protein